jgi:proteasome lid subunit RPN8/RPN11
MAKPQPSKLADQYQTYPTANAAAVAALRGIANKKVESGGGILFNKDQGTYAATEPVGQSDGSHFSAAVGVPNGWQLHSTYHTHPSGDRSTQFSNDDINISRQLKAPSYILAQDDDKIRMFDPTSSKVLNDRSIGHASNNMFSNGSLVDETPAPPPSDAATPPPPPPPPATAAVVPVTGSRITMKDFAAHHRARTTKYKHKIVHIKTGAPKRP